MPQQPLKPKLEITFVPPSTPNNTLSVPGLANPGAADFNSAGTGPSLGGNLSTGGATTTPAAASEFTPSQTNVGGNLSVPGVTTQTDTGSFVIKQTPQTTSTTNKSSSSKSSSSNKSNKQREIECPVCGGGKKKIITNNTAKPVTSSQSSNRFCGSVPLQKISDFLGSIGNLIKSIFSSERTKTVQSIFEGGKCPECGNKNVIPDPTDRSKQEQAAATKAEQLQQKITETEAKLGPPGGNDYKLITGDRVLEVGLGYNDTPSYTVLKDQGRAIGGGKVEKDGVVTTYEKVNAVVGTNPLSTPGGKYVIKCSNSFKVRAGAQGIELNTEGPLIIKAGQTQFVGPEISIGSSTGQVVIEGNNLSLGGKNVVLNAGTEGNGQISFNGTVYATGNFTAQGGAHFDGDVSCNSMTMPGKVNRSQVSSQDTQVTGAAVWQNEAATQALKNFLRVRQIRLNDLVGGIGATEREKQNTAAEQKDLLKKSLPVDSQPCGYAIVNGAPCPVFLFPHHHTLDDMVHAHDSLGPYIQLTPDSQTMRQTVAGPKMLAAPAPANLDNTSALDSLFTTLRGLPIVKQIVSN
jgi:hypothetical protein